MDRDPLALPGEPDYNSGPDSDIEVISEDGEKDEHVNSNTLLEVELVPADMTYVNKITGSGNKRGRKKKETEGVKVIDTGETQLQVKLIQSPGVLEKDIETGSEFDDEESFKGTGKRGRPPGKVGRPKKKKGPVENDFKPNPKSTHFSRSSRYEQLQEKKDEFLQQESARKAAFKAKYQKHVERAKEKYRQKRENAEKTEKVLMPVQKKLYRKICMLAMKIFHLDKSKSKEELIKEMSLEWKADREKFWENYKKRWKEVALHSVKPMTKERAEFLKKRGQKYDQLKQEHSQMVNRVSTRNRNRQDDQASQENSPGSSLMGYHPGGSFDGFENDDDEPNVINYAEYLEDTEFNAEENEMENNDESFLLAMTTQDQSSDMFPDPQEMYGNELLEEYQTNTNENSCYYEEENEETFPTQLPDETDFQLNGYS